MKIKKQINEMIKNPQYAFGIIGKKGFGKSSIVKECCRENNIKYIDIRLSTIQEDDLGGLPRLDKNGDYFEYKAPKWAYEIINNKNQQYMILLDEFNQSTPEVLNALFDLVLGDEMPNGTVVRRIANVELPTNVCICLLGNEEDDNPYISEIPPALMDRVLWIPFDCNLQNYKDYFISKFNDLGIKFFDSFYNVEDELNPRSVERFLNLMQHNTILDSHLEFIKLNFIDNENTELLSRLYTFLTTTEVKQPSSKLNEALKTIKEKGILNGR